MPTGRYSSAAVSLEVSKRIALRGRGTRKELAEYLGVEPTSVSHTLSGRYHWSLDMLSAVAEFFDAPPGWPLIPWEIAERAFGSRK